MIFVSICVGSSCHLKGSEELVEMFQKRISEERLEDDIVLSGSFCLGRCNREGVTVTLGDGINDDTYVGVTPDRFAEFWRTEIVPRLGDN